MLSKKVQFIILVSVLLFSTGLALAGDETQITEICKNGGVIQLEARTYIISNSFSIPSDTDLRGSNGTVLMLADNCGIPQNIPMIDLTGKKT